MPAAAREATMEARAAWVSAEVLANSTAFQKERELSPHGHANTKGRMWWPRRERFRN